MVGALEETGALDEVADGIASVTGGNRTAELLGILWVSAIGSGLVDNIPFTAAMIPVVDSLADDDAYWWALALGACFGGNATIVAAACNVAASGMAARAGHPIGFLAFLRYGLAVTARHAHPRHRLHPAEVRMSPQHHLRASAARTRDPPHRRHDRARRPRTLLDSDLPALPVVDEPSASPASSASASS